MIKSKVDCSTLSNLKIKTNTKNKNLNGLGISLCSCQKKNETNRLFVQYKRSNGSKNTNKISSVLNYAVEI